MISHIPINKIKSVIIGDGLVFRPHKNTLKDLASGEMATLNNVATQLLLYLLQNGKEISSRDEILLNVFQHNGARATDANLNQHISAQSNNVYGSSCRTHRHNSADGISDGRR